MWTKFGGRPKKESTTHDHAAPQAHRTAEATSIPRSAPVDTGMAGPESPATVARESASPRLCGSPQPLTPATEKLLQNAVPVLRSSCCVRNVGGPDFHPDRFRFHSHLAPPSPSPHLMWTKSGGLPKKESNTHDHAAQATYAHSPQNKTCTSGHVETNVWISVPSRNHRQNATLLP